MRNSMDFACMQRLGLDPPFAAEEKSFYSQGAGSALHSFGQLDCNPSIQSGYSSTFGLNSAGALGMTVDSHCPSSDTLGMVGAHGARQMNNSDLSAYPPLGSVVSKSYQTQPDFSMDTNLTNCMPDLWSLFGDTSNWTELCSLSSDEFANQSLPQLESQQDYVKSSAAAAQQPPCIAPHPTPTQQQHPPPCILPHSDMTQPPEPCTYFCCAAPQDHIHSHGNSGRSPSNISWQISEVVDEGVVNPYGGNFLRSGISPGGVSAISSEDSCDTAVINSFAHGPHVPATSVDGKKMEFQPVNSWISEGPPASKKFRAMNSWPSALTVPEEWETTSAAAITAATCHSVSNADPLLSSLDVGTDLGTDMKVRSMPSKGHRVQDSSSNALGRMRNFHAMPSSANLCMPSMLGDHDLGSWHSSPSLNFTGERFKDLEPQFPARLPELTAAEFHPLEEGLTSKTYSEQKAQGFRSTRKQTTTSIEPQSVAARHRRKRISERVRILESIIPGGSKLDTASMLDESIDYVKFLQLQVHLLESLDSHGHGTDWSASGGREIGDEALRSSVPVRSSGCPLIVTEVLQQQLFKQKLCLVSLSQVSAGRNPKI